MNNNIKGASRIGEKIKAEALDFAKEKTDAAYAEAEKLISSAKKASDEKVEEILARAKEKADAVVESAKSSAGMRQRNGVLALKGEMLAKALERAVERLVSLPADKYLSVMSSLLAETANGFLGDGDEAYVHFSDRDKPLASDIIDAAKKAMTVKAELKTGDRQLSAKAGFVLASGDTEINCVAEAVINSAKKDLEKPVLDILFPGK